MSFVFNVQCAFESVGPAYRLVAFYRWRKVDVTVGYFVRPTPLFSTFKWLIGTSGRHTPPLAVAVHALYQDGLQNPTLGRDSELVVLRRWCRPARP